MSSLLRLTACVLPGLLTLDACKQLDVCEGVRCEASIASTAGTSSSHGGRSTANEGSEAAAGAPDHVAGAAGEAGQAGGAEPGPEPLECEAGLGDCDYSRLTGCETPLGWAVRNCGACGQSCADACGDGVCLNDLLLVEDATLVDFVSNANYAFGSLGKMDGSNALIRIGMVDGQVDELLLIGDYSELALGDRVYLLDGETRLLQSMAQDGSDLRLEQTEGATSLGAYAGGTYYVSSVWDEDSSRDVQTLRFRPSGASGWQTIKEQARGDIRSSSDYGVIYVETDVSEDSEQPDVEHLYVVQGSTITAFGTAPPNMSDVLAVDDRIAVLTTDYETSLNELWWLDDYYPPVRFELPKDGVSPTMRPFRDEVVISLTEGKDGYVQRFDENGGLPGRIGVRLGSSLVALDEHYLFHSVADDWAAWRVLRTTWNE
jgi:hypothetical protein